MFQIQKRLNTKRGFTLIELLVVIAIIGILSSVVLASLNTARSKGNDAAIKANLVNIRAQAELFYDDTGSYGVQTSSCASGMFRDDQNINNAILAAEKASGGGNEATCISSSIAWAISVPLRSDSQIHWCVDSTGFSGEKRASPLAVCS